MAQAPIAVIILSWNRPLYLWAALDSLYRHTRQPARFILVDNNSDDPGVGDVVTGFTRRGMFHTVDWASVNSPTRPDDSMSKYRPLFGEFFVYVESDTLVLESDPCWLSRFCELMDAHPRLGLLGSYIDNRDFVEPRQAAAIAPALDAAHRAALIKENSMERQLPAVPPPSEIIDPFNPPGRLLAIRTRVFDTVGFAPDGLLYTQVKAAGWEAGIATDIRHRHLSLLNFFDYPGYDTQARDRFFMDQVIPDGSKPGGPSSGRRPGFEPCRPTTERYGLHLPGWLRRWAGRN